MRDGEIAKNAKITSTMLGLGRGIPTFMLDLDCGSFAQGFGGIALGNVEPLFDILRVVGVEKWEDLKGQHVRVLYEDGGYSPLGIGHIVEDRWWRLSR